MDAFKAIINNYSYTYREYTRLKYTIDSTCMEVVLDIALICQK